MQACAFPFFIRVRGTCKTVQYGAGITKSTSKAAASGLRIREGILINREEYQIYMDISTFATRTRPNPLPNPVLIHVWVVLTSGGYNTGTFCYWCPGRGHCSLGKKIPLSPWVHFATCLEEN